MRARAGDESRKMGVGYDERCSDGKYVYIGAKTTYEFPR